MDRVEHIDERAKDNPLAQESIREGHDRNISKERIQVIGMN